ncbi:TetR/AcrR family transcriptional regulator [Pseudonocardia sp. TRM90224]|uniref:TetR/AcrR family transcriptional regulator n=1 Tax=Pseudonocardia sp. TRM90224 TaxID=2812678 RepID=UPI001E47CB5C|nr:TetR/AcrR family transcriptional regulator [Pseudonocardia sp. TRM90224]
MAPPARQRILTAADRLLRERGVSRLTTREIAQEADAAEGSLTKNFGGKLGLLTTLLSRELPELGAWRAAATPPGQRALRAVLVDLIERGIDFYAASLPLVAGAIADRDLFAKYQEVNAEAGTGPHLAINTVADYLTSCQQAGLLAPSADPYSLALALCGAAQAQAYTEYVVGPDALRGSRRDRAAALADTLLAGVTA